MDRNFIATCLIALSGMAACSSSGGTGTMMPADPGATPAAGGAAPTATTPGATTMTGAMTAQPSTPTAGTGAAAQPSQPASPPSQSPPSTPTAGTGSSAMMPPGMMPAGMMPAGMMPAGMMPSDMMPSGKGTLPPVMSVKDPGPYAVTIEMGEAAGGGWVAHPTEMGKDGVKHPIFLWGCGGGSEPMQYTDHMKLIASHGFVMESHVSSGNATDHSRPLMWLLAENDKQGSKYYQKLDTTKIAAGGHSMGSIATFAFEATTDKLTTSLHVAGGSFDGNGFMQLKTPTLHVGGKDDTLAGSNTMRDFMRTTVPTFYVNIDDTDHLYAARNGLPVMIAWMRWHLAGEEDRKAMFVGDKCEFCAPPFNGMAKNWK
jgi:hypothetical protein